MSGNSCGGEPARRRTSALVHVGNPQNTSETDVMSSSIDSLQFIERCLCIVNVTDPSVLFPLSNDVGSLTR